jgi:hypothetical protein
LVLSSWVVPCKMQVRWLSEIRHRNIVTLIGYCQEGGLQMLVYEYLPNGSVCSHLYGNVQLLLGKKIGAFLALLPLKLHIIYQIQGKAP